MEPDKKIAQENSKHNENPSMKTLLLSIAVALAALALHSAKAEDIRFPQAANVTDVTRPPYNAKGDGVTDDTAALQQALDDRVKLIYLPDGTYLISDTLRWGKGQKRQILQGQSEAGTIIRLRDSLESYQDPANPKPMAWTGKAPAQRFRNGIRNLTFDTGKNNPGAIGVQYIANNQGSIHHVTIQSGDPDHRGVIGLDLGYTNEQGPCLIKDVTVVGFDTGVFTNFAVNSVVFEDLHLRNQRVVGLLNRGQCISLRRLKSYNTVPAIHNAKGPNLTTIIDSELVGLDDAPTSAIVHEWGGLFARNLKTPGYAHAIRHGRDQPQYVESFYIDEFVSHDPLSLFDSPASSLNLPIKDTPTIQWDPPETWTAVTDFGPPEVVTIQRDKSRRKQAEDWSGPLQRAIDSGATTIYFPVRAEGFYGLYGEVVIRGAVRRIIGLENFFEYADLNDAFTPTIVVGDGDAPEVLIERFDLTYSGIKWIHEADRVVVFSSMTVHSLEVNTGAGDVFLEDVVGGHVDLAPGTRLWARQLNLEGWHEPKSHNAGGNFWVLGLKTETDSTAHKVSAGGRSEIVGGFIYANKARIEPKQMFINDEASLSFTIGEWVGRNQPFDPAKETRDGQIRRLNKGDAHRRAQGALIPLYTGYQSPDDQANKQESR